MLKARKDTTEKSKHTGIIDISKQQLIGILGVRGSGKSYLGESLLEQYYKCGYTCLDLWASPNLENAFWIFARKDHKKRIPVTILAPESFIMPDQEIENFNNLHFTKVPLVKIAKIPTPTAKAESEVNDRILEIITDIILECRDKRRILVFNPFMFPDERSMFRILEILMRNLITISQNHFHANTPEILGKPRSEFTMHEKTHHKIACLIREFGEVSPARIKGDKSGESTLIKKALLKFVRLARHFSVDLVIDYQNASDAESAIRNQIDVWILKKWSRELAGDNFNWVFDVVDKQRDKIYQKAGFGKKGDYFADQFYPKIERLAKNWVYVLRQGHYPKLMKTPELGIAHKEPEQKWHVLTGISLEHDRNLIQKNGSESTSKTKKSDEKLVYLTLKTLKEQKGSKKMKWSEISQKMGEMQQSGEITYHLPFNEMKDGTISKIYSRMKTSHDKED